VLCLGVSVAGGVAVEVSVNGGADYTSDGKQYMYEAGALVSEVRPSRGISGMAGQVVTVVGAHFVHSGDLSCLFGVDGNVQALYVSSSVVSCIVPARSDGVVSVSVSNNGS